MRLSRRAVNKAPVAPRCRALPLNFDFRWGENHEAFRTLREDTSSWGRACL